MATRLTPFSKLLLTVIIVAAIVLGGRWFLNNTDVGGDLKDQAQQNNNSNTEEPVRERDRPRNNNNSSGSDDNPTMTFDREYPGTAVERMLAVRARVAELAQNDDLVGKPWEEIRRKILWGVQLRIAG